MNEEEDEEEQRIEMMKVVMKHTVLVTPPV